MLFLKSAENAIFHHAAARMLSHKELCHCSLQGVKKITSFGPGTGKHLFSGAVKHLCIPPVNELYHRRHHTALLVPKNRASITPWVDALNLSVCISHQGKRPRLLIKWWVISSPSTVSLAACPETFPQGKCYTVRAEPYGLTPLSWLIFVRDGLNCSSLSKQLLSFL